MPVVNLDPKPLCDIHHEPMEIYSLTSKKGGDWYAQHCEVPGCARYFDDDGYFDLLTPGDKTYQDPPGPRCELDKRIMYLGKAEKDKFTYYCTEPHPNRSRVVKRR